MRTSRKKWLRHHYRYQPRQVQRVLLNDFLQNDLRALLILARRFPKNYTVRARVVSTLHNKGRRAEARRLWIRNVRDFPGEAAPFFQRGHWALSARRFAEAAKYLTLCLRFDGGYFRETALFWRAECFFQLRQYSAALSDLSLVSDEYEERWFLDYKKRSKADLLADIQRLTGSLS